jgi:hypothetical protein
VSLAPVILRDRTGFGGYRVQTGLRDARGTGKAHADRPFRPRVNQIGELGKKGSTCLENLAIGSVGVLRENHIGELGCQIDRRAFKFGGLNGSQTAISRVSDNKAAGFGIDLKDIARDIGKAIWTDDVAERYLVSWYVRAVSVDIGERAIRPYADTLHASEAEVSTGNYADTGQTLGAQTGENVSLQAQNSLLQTITDTNQTVATRLSTTEPILGNLQTNAQDLRNSPLENMAQPQMQAPSKRLGKATYKT